MREKKHCSTCVNSLYEDSSMGYCEDCYEGICMLCYLNNGKNDDCKKYEEYTEVFSECFVEGYRLQFLFCDGIAIACTDFEKKERLNKEKASKAIEIAIEGFFLKHVV